MHNQKGFSLIELIVVITIIAIAVGIIIPVYSSMKPKLRLNGAARQIQGDLMRAKMQAISQNNKFRIIYVDDHQYKILDDDDDSGDVNGNESIVTKDIQTNYYDVTYSSSNSNNLIFSPRGTAANLTTITLTNPSGTSTVSVSITGRVKID